MTKRDAEPSELLASLGQGKPLPKRDCLRVAEELKQATAAGDPDDDDPPDSDTGQ